MSPLYVPASLASFGFVRAFAMGVVGTATAWGVNNDAHYMRVVEGGTISAIRVRVANNSGNISVGVYRNSGAGLAAVPGARVATSGAVACPAIGDRDVALGAAVYVNPGDWLGMSCDNTTATFVMASDLDSTLFAGQAYRQATAHPVPDPAASLIASTSRMPLLVGV